MISNPNPVVKPTVDKDEIADLAADAASAASATATNPKAPYIVKQKGYASVDHDAVLDTMFGHIETKIVNVDAKLMERTGADHFGRPLFEAKHYRNLNEMMRSPQCIERVRKVYTDSKLKEISQRYVEVHKISKKEQKAIREAQARGRRLKESCGDFSMGLYNDEVSGNSNVFPLEDTFLPSTTSPYSKQMLWADYLDMHRKCFEAATRNPIAKRICRIIPQFVLGRGVTGKTKDPERQKVWNEYWKRNKMRQRLKVTLRELIIYGEIFHRYFKTRDGIAVRSIDPSTIWDIVTDPEDLENVLWYHQQYVIINRSVVPEIAALIPSTLVIRQIPGEDVYHAKINATSSEKRGRSELLAILGWLLRFKEFANDRVLLNKMRAMFALDVKVTGSPSDVASAQGQFQTPPGPGAVLVHNEAVEIDFKTTNTGASEAKTDAEMILKIIAVGAGVSEQFLGVSNQTNRASALIQSEPDVKNFQDYQEIIESLLQDSSERVFLDADLGETGGDEEDLEFTFPSIAQEDRSGKLKDLALMESMDYFSKRRSAEMSAREFDVTDYDYDTEQQDIREERLEQPVISAPYQQVPKEAPAPPPGAPGTDPNNPQGDGGPPAPSNPTPEQSGPANAGPVNPGGGTAKPVPHQAAQAGFSAKKGGGRQLPNTKPTAFRPGFSAGAEKKKVANNRTSGTPQRQAMVTESKRRNVWSPDARRKSLEVRQQRAAVRRKELTDIATDVAKRVVESMPKPEINVTVEAPAQQETISEIIKDGKGNTVGLRKRVVKDGE